jgi:hypothetical protein
MKRKQWSFARPTKVRVQLSKEEENYWLNIMGKILKVGIEFEFNLPEKKGKCSGVCGFCACTKDKNNQCNQKCSNAAICRDTGDCSVCLYKINKECSKRPKTKRCEKFKLVCMSDAVKFGLDNSCIDFKLPCLECVEYTTECDKCPMKSKTKSPQEIRDELTEVLYPSNFVGETGKYGVLLVTKDGSLVEDGGVEIPTVGRRPHFPTIYRMCERIIDECTSRGAYVNHRTSLHVHVLAGYLDSNPVDKADNGRTSRMTVSELEKPVPEIILDNFHQLIRRFQNALVWMSAAVYEPEKYKHSITRWGRFRQSLVPFSAIQNRMASIIKDMRSNYKKVHGIGTNTFINYSLVKFDPDYNISTFHVEGRFMDGTLSPAAVTAFAILHYALVLKAIELSRYGILESFDSSELSRAKEIQAALMNREAQGWDSDRISDNSELDPYIPILKEESKELVYLLKGVLEKFPPAFDILMKLADKPIAYRLKDYGKKIDSDTWKAIERDIINEQPTDENKEKIKTAVMELAKISAIIECEREDNWIEEVLVVMEDDESIIKKEKSLALEVISELISERKLFWSKSVGAYINVTN